MNLRPFLEAGVLRKSPNVKWTKDEGKQRERVEPPWFSSGDTPNTLPVNDIRLATAEKQAARDKLEAREARP